MDNRRFDRYIALGDSISIDKYPALDLGSRGREGCDRAGAVSLFYKNCNELWPEFDGTDLRTRFPQIRFDAPPGRSRGNGNLTEDGWTTKDVLHDLDELRPCDDRTLITLTVGGNDLVGAIGGRSFGPVAAISPVPGLTARLRQLVTTVLDLYPRGELLLATIYDPSDGTNRLDPWGMGEPLEEEARWLAATNDFIRDLAAKTPRVHLADIHKHFLGHGVTVPTDQRWYWSGLIIEPNARGASEVRRVWMDLLATL